MYSSYESNPFAPIRAADYTDRQINELWVEIGGNKINAILEPRSLGTKYILGSKGSGKTHLLRYQTFQVARQRTPKKSGLSIVEAAGCLAVFLRTTNIDAPRFELVGGAPAAWQQLFAIHLELRLAELVLDTLQDIKSSTLNEFFDDTALLNALASTVGKSDQATPTVNSIEDLQAWTKNWLHKIDSAINSAAFSGVVDIRLPFAIGGLSLPLGSALRQWHPSFEKFHLIYILDEIENLTEKQQEVVNTLVRYAEGRATFRLTGRLYARKTLATIADGEGNREGSEFSVIRLDDILRSWKNYDEFASKFVSKRMTGGRGQSSSIDPADTFEEIDVNAFIERFTGPINDSRFIKLFREAAAKSKYPKLQHSDTLDEVVRDLTDSFPPLLQRLNVLLFCKKYGRTSTPQAVAKRINADSHY